MRSLLITIARSWLITIALISCEHGQTPLTDGAMPGDGRDAGDCNFGSLISGELIDWDSSTANFLGVNGATITLNGDSSISLVTPPNGRIDLCARPDLPLEFAIVGPTDFPDGTLSIERDAVGGELSLRMFSDLRAPSFFNEQGLVFNPNLAQVVVLLAGDRSAMSLDRTHDAEQAGNDDDGDGEVTWTAGSTGRYVLFPNVDVSASTATVSGDPMGPKTVPIAAGKISLVVISFVFF